MARWRSPPNRHALKALVGLLLSVAAIANGYAINRCVTESGQIVYTDMRCVAIGARHEREVTSTISVIPSAPVPPVTSNQVSPGEKEIKPEPRPFKRSPKSPLMTFCYDPKDARKDVSSEDIQDAIRKAIPLWNEGCSVDLQFTGLCAPNDGTYRPGRPIDYKVYWESWDDSLKLNDRSDLATEHAIAMAGPGVGITLNRDIAERVFLRQYRRAIAHELGHVIGMNHSTDKGDLMYSGGLNGMPTKADFEACNQTVQDRFGVRRTDK